MQALREEAHRQIGEETRIRIKYNPHPTEEELQIGAFKEQLEPQVRDAIFTMIKKGYIPESSGFGDEHGEMQVIDGYFTIDQNTKKKLEDMGMTVTVDEERGQDYTHIYFRPKTTDILSIKDTWDQCAALLPEQESKGEISISGGSSDFRTRYAVDRFDIEKKELRRALAFVDLHPDFQTLYRQRLEELETSPAPSSRKEFEKQIDALSEKLWPRVERSEEE